MMIKQMSLLLQVDGLWSHPAGIKFCIFTPQIVAMSVIRLELITLSIIVDVYYLHLYQFY